jgi:hypothetical protein
MNKPRVFIRFFPGASGNFFSLLLHMLSHTPKPVAGFTGHIHSDDVYSGHNFREGHFVGSKNLHTPRELNEFRSKVENYTKYTNPEAPLNEAVLYLTSNFRFTETDNPIYTVPTHAMDPKVLLFAYHPAKLINIQTTEADCEQIWYNTVIKQVIPNQKELITLKILEYFKTKYPEKANRPKFNRVDFSDERFLCYLYKFNSERPEGYYNTFNNFVLGTGYDYLNIPFSSIDDESLADRFDELVDYMGVETDPQRKAIAKDALSKYASVQIQNPYKDLHIDDY